MGKRARSALEAEEEEEEEEDEEEEDDEEETDSLADGLAEEDVQAGTVEDLLQSVQTPEELLEKIRDWTASMEKTGQQFLVANDRQLKSHRIGQIRKIFFAHLPWQ